MRHKIENNSMRVWWSSRVPITDESLEHYEVKTIQEAKNKIEELTKRDLSNKNITDNVGGLEIFEIEKGCEYKGEWCEWYCPNDDCCEDILGCECK